MTDIPAQRAAEPDPYLTWQEAGLGPDTAVDIGDGTSVSLRELLGESEQKEDD